MENDGPDYQIMGEEIQQQWCFRMGAAAENYSTRGYGTLAVGSSMSRRRSRSRSSPATPPPLDDEGLLREILIRLPPEPSSLPRASAVCRRWRILLSNLEFLRRFRRHHQKPPLLGFFQGIVGSTRLFRPILGPPDRIPAARFSLPEISIPYFEQWDFQGCRHGLAVLINQFRRQVVVVDPLTDQRHCMDLPLGLDNDRKLCRWRSLRVIEKPAGAHITSDHYTFQLLRTKESGLGFSVLSKLTIKLWERKLNCDGVIEWLLLQKNIQLEELFPRKRLSYITRVLIMGYDEDTNVVVLSTMIGVFMLNLDTMQLKRIQKTKGMCYAMFSPYTNVYTAAVGKLMLHIDSKQIRHIIDIGYITYEAFIPKHTSIIHKQHYHELSKFQTAQFLYSRKACRILRYNFVGFSAVGVLFELPRQEND
uniref:F-box domain-containing protein n=1 Tax=Aegilops tauschii TaxID=37682 RepID=R7W6N5_AEGTA